MEQIGHADAAFRKAGTYDIRRARCFLRFRGIVINLRKSTERKDENTAENSEPGPV